MAQPPVLTAPNGDPISRFCFGTMQFGGKADAAQSRAMYDACRAAGINFFDTAYGYTNGASETLLGGSRKPERETLFIATKCAHPEDTKAATITRQFDESRERLDMEIVDLLYLHRCWTTAHRWKRPSAPSRGWSNWVACGISACRTSRPGR